MLKEELNTEAIRETSYRDDQPYCDIVGACLRHDIKYPKSHTSSFQDDRIKSKMLGGDKWYLCLPLPCKVKSRHAMNWHSLGDLGKWRPIAAY
jgi:hypothetical protein